ncbi:MAG: thiol reductant ABC exporter subunit CydD [Neobacillus sp.]
MDKTLISYKGAKPVLTGLAILTFLQAFTIIIQAYFLADAISSLLRGELLLDVIDKLGIFITALTVRQLLNVSKKNLAYHFSARISQDYRKRLLEKLFSLGPRYVKNEGSGQTVTLVIEGTMRFRRYLELFLPKLVNMLFIPAIILLFILSLNSRSAIILLVTFPIVIIFMILLGKAAKSKADRQYESYHLLSNHFVDSIRGLETLKHLGLSKQHIKKIALVSERYRKATLETLRIAFLSSFALDFFTMLSIATVAVFLGLGLINGTMDLHPALTILILSPEFFLPIREAGSDYHATLDGKNAGKKFQEILNQSLPIQPLDCIATGWKPSSTLLVKELNVTFPDNDVFGLEDINLSISGFKNIGIIGASGSGKSTLIDVLSGFISPSEGEFIVEGKTTTSLSQQNWQRQITYIPQHPSLFHESIFNNIRLYQPDATKQEVLMAAEKAGLLEVIATLPQGLETIVGEGGQSLSGGQEQRIALARAFLDNRPILMLDEPTAHLDIETEAELKETMKQLFQHKLVFFATHRLHWMLEMDQIIVLDNGRIAEIGTHEQLMENKGTYYQLIMSQLGGD